MLQRDLARDLGARSGDLAAEALLDAESSVDRSPEERVAMFRGILLLIDEAWNALHLEEDERRRRLDTTHALEPRPEPWWRDVRPEALP